MNIIFFGSSDYCLSVLESINNHFQLAAIITTQNSNPKRFASSHNIKMFTPKSRDELISLISPIRQIQPDLAIIADYGMIIPREIFNIPRYKTLNIHFSKLPKYRGPSPVQYTILMGEESAWISVIIMDEGIDTGDIIWQKEVILVSEAHPGSHWDSGQARMTASKGYNETTESLYKKLFNIIALELPDVINKYVNKKLKPQKQDNLKATYTKHFTRSDGYVSPHILTTALNRGVESIAIERKVRAFTPWPGVWTYIMFPESPKTPGRWPAYKDSFKVERSEKTSKKRLKILKAHLEPTPHNTQPTTRLVPDLVQLEGKKPVTWKQFKEGYPKAQFEG